MMDYYSHPSFTGGGQRGGKRGWGAGARDGAEWSNTPSIQFIKNWHFQCCYGSLYYYKKDYKNYIFIYTFLFHFFTQNVMKLIAMVWGWLNWGGLCLFSVFFPHFLCYKSRRGEACGSRTENFTPSTGQGGGVLRSKKMTYLMHMIREPLHGSLYRTDFSPASTNSKGYRSWLYLVSFKPSPSCNLQ